MVWFKIGEGVRQNCILSPCLFSFYAEYIMSNAGLDEHKLGSTLPGEISITYVWQNQYNIVKFKNKIKFKK